MKPNATEYPVYYRPYIGTLESDDLGDMFRSQVRGITSLSSTLTEELALNRYAEGKWSIKEMLGHLIDCERVFAYRAMCIARGETQALSGFDENAYVASASFDQRPIARILDEFIAVRNSTIILLDSLTSVEFLLSGVANGNPVTVRALMWIIAGHTQHHLQILKERNGVEV